MFLIAAATEESGRDVLIGAFIGLALAGLLAYLVYWGGKSLPMRLFFKVTGVILIVFAAGLLAAPCCTCNRRTTSVRST